MELLGKRLRELGSTHRHFRRTILATATELLSPSLRGLPDPPIQSLGGSVAMGWEIGIFWAGDSQNSQEVYFWRFWSPCVFFWKWILTNLRSWNPPILKKWMQEVKIIEARPTILGSNSLSFWFVANQAIRLLNSSILIVASRLVAKSLSLILWFVDTFTSIYQRTKPFVGNWVADLFSKDLFWAWFRGKSQIDISVLVHFRLARSPSKWQWAFHIFPYEASLSDWICWDHPKAGSPQGLSPTTNGWVIGKFLGTTGTTRHKGVNTGNAWMVEELRRALQWVQHILGIYSYLYLTTLPFLSGSFDHDGSAQQSKHDEHPFGSTQCLKEFDLQTCGLLKQLKGLLILSSNCDLRMRPVVSNSCVIFKTGSSSQVSCLPNFFTGQLKVHPWILLVVGTSPYGYNNPNTNLRHQSQTWKSFQNLFEPRKCRSVFVWWFYFFIFPASCHWIRRVSAIRSIFHSAGLLSSSCDGAAGANWTHSESMTSRCLAEIQQFPPFCSRKIVPKWMRSSI